MYSQLPAQISSEVIRMQRGGFICTVSARADSVICKIKMYKDTVAVRLQEVLSSIPARTQITLYVAS